MIPYIAVGYEKDGKPAADLSDTAPAVFASGEVKSGQKSFPINDPSCYSAPGNKGFEKELKFVGWYTGDGKVWQLQYDKVWEDTVLYPVWKDSDGKLYKVMRYEDPESGLKICNSVKEGTEVLVKPKTAGEQ